MAIKAIFVHRTINRFNSNINLYTFVTSDYSIRTIQQSDMVQMIRRKELQVSNLALQKVGNKVKIVTTNGAIDNYPHLKVDDGKEFKTAVILEKFVVDGVVKGYTVFMPDKTIDRLNVVDTIKVYREFNIANGKIRHTQQGDIISSVHGSYPVASITTAKAAVAKKADKNNK